jgi:hypothetical protein
VGVFLLEENMAQATRLGDLDTGHDACAPTTLVSASPMYMSMTALLHVAYRTAKAQVEAQAQRMK